MEDKNTDFEEYDIADLELIINDQGDLYSEEELERAKELLERKKHEEISNRNTTADLSIKDVDRMFTMLCVCALLSPLCGIVSCVGIGVKCSARLREYMKTLIAATIVSLILRAMYFGMTTNNFMSFI